MQNLKVINKQNLISNLKQYDKKKICAMVKANAYGHGLSEVVSIVEPFVDYFGVVNIEEGEKVRKLTDVPILICSKTKEWKKCAKSKLEVIVDNETEIFNCLKYGLKNLMHLKINCGMNRYGTKSLLNLRMINDLLGEYNITLKSICTHFPCSENKQRTWKNYNNFLRLSCEITQNCLICFGGSGIYNYPFEFDMLRLGIGMYGYGGNKTKPVMSVYSYVSKTFYADTNEYVGYGKNFKVKRRGKFAVVSVGYGDGLRRNLSGRFYVKIKNKFYKAVGNICMDAFFVKVDENVKEGDVVEVMTDANIFAKKTKTISYEILTGFSNLRGKTIIKDE